MTLNLTFEEKDFESFRDFQKAVTRQTGRCYVGTSYVCIYYPFPTALCDRLKPYPENKQLEFELSSTYPDTKW